jgi:hypothetical protein
MQKVMEFGVICKGQSEFSHNNEQEQSLAFSNQV